MRNKSEELQKARDKPWDPKKGQEQIPKSIRTSGNKLKISRRWGTHLNNSRTPGTKTQDHLKMSLTMVKEQTLRIPLGTETTGRRAWHVGGRWDHTDLDIDSSVCTALGWRGDGRRSQPCISPRQTHKYACLHVTLKDAHSTRPSRRRFKWGPWTLYTLRQMALVWTQLYKQPVNLWDATS